MTNGRTERAIQHLHGSLLARASETADAQLLEMFVNRQDEAAFEALVLRHGPMVLGVCRRILGDSHDAEDAFQAAFLVLVRKAASIVPRAMVANWLYGVAYRTANKARVMNAKRRAKEMHVRERPAPPEAHEELFWREIVPLLDCELQAMPSKYRAPIVLCDLEGKARKAAAQELGWPEGTLSSRLAAARKMLARRLVRRGVSLPSAGVPLLLAATGPTPVPLPLVASTVKVGLLVAAGHTVAAAGVSKAVAVLTDAAVKAMLLSKVKAALAVVVAAIVLGAGVSVFVRPDAAHPAVVPGISESAIIDVAAPPVENHMPRTAALGRSVAEEPRQPIAAKTDAGPAVRKEHVVVVFRGCCARALTSPPHAVPTSVASGNDAAGSALPRPSVAHQDGGGRIIVIQVCGGGCTDHGHSAITDRATIRIHIYPGPVSILVL